MRFLQILIQGGEDALFILHDRAFQAGERLLAKGNVPRAAGCEIALLALYEFFDVDGQKNAPFACV